jgi:hypothetical protein
MITIRVFGIARLAARLFDCGNPFMLTMLSSFCTPASDAGEFSSTICGPPSWGATSPSRPDYFLASGF